MERPDLATLACVNAACQQLRQRGQDNLVIRKVYGHDRMRLLRCRACGKEFSERRGTAFFNTKIAEEKAAAVINHLDEGCSVRATARLAKVAKTMVARRLRLAGRHAQRLHDQHVYGLRPRAVEFAVGLYNFCRPHSSLKIKPETRMTPRSPALAAGLTDHIWSTREWLLRPALGGQG